MEESDFDQMENDHLDRLFSWKHECEDCNQRWTSSKEIDSCPDCNGSNVFHFSNEE